MVQYMPKQRRNCLCQMESKHDHQVLCKLPDIVQLQVWIGVSYIFFYCIAELAIKPCRSSRSKLRGEFGIPKHLQNRKQKHDKATNTPNPKHNTKQKGHGKCLEGETRGEKRVKRPKRPNALICRTPGGSIRYPLSCSLGMTLISHSIVSIPASPSRFAI